VPQQLKGAENSNREKTGFRTNFSEVKCKYLSDRANLAGSSTEFGFKRLREIELLHATDEKDLENFQGHYRPSLLRKRRPT